MKRKVPAILRGSSLLAVSLALTLTGCTSPAGISSSPTKAGSSSSVGTTPSQEIAAQDPQGNVSLKVLSVVNAHVDSVSLGKTYRGYGLRVLSQSVDPADAYSAWYFTTTSTSSLYASRYQAQAGTLTYYLPKVLDPSGISVSRNGQQASRLVGSLDGGSNLYAFFETPQGDSTLSGRDSLSYQVPNGLCLPRLEYGTGAPMTSNWIEYYTLPTSGTDTFSYSQWREFKATITVKDLTGASIQHLTQDNFAVTTDGVSPSSDGQSHLLATAVTEVGNGVYEFSELVYQRSQGSKIKLAVTIVNGNGTGSTTF